MIPFVHAGEKTVVYMSDLIPTTANIPLSGWPGMICTPLPRWKKKNIS
jgi:hypothetical protein